MAASLLALAGTAGAANVTFNLCATSGQPAADNPISESVVEVYGYASGACSAVPATTVSAPGGPVLRVSQGDVVTVNLQNMLPTPTGLLFQGQAMVPDMTGAAAATVSAFGSKTYTFTAAKPGTYLYEAAPLPGAEHQVAMGLYGALVVLPTTAGQAYNDTAVSPAIPASAYKHEAVLVLSELDPALNNSLNPAAFDMRTYAPKFFLINGKPYPKTDLIRSADPNTPIAAGERVLLRYVNAGARHHSMAVLGVRQNFVAKDASLLPTLTRNVVAETLAPGQTGDAIVTVPGTVTTESRFAVYDASLALHNNGADNAFGGMMTFLTAGTGASTAGPTTSGVTLTPSRTGGPNPAASTLSATITAAASGSAVGGAEYFFDAVGASGTGCPMTGSAPTFSVVIPTTGGVAPCANMTTLSSGNHTIYVHGRDSATTPQWGAVSSAVLVLDKTGPATSGLGLSPNPSNGTGTVALSATANDSASGNSKIAAAEYTVSSGTTTERGPLPMAVSSTSVPVASLTASIAAGLSAGTHTVSVRSQDAFGNWGAPATINLVIASTGPTTSQVSASPNPANGVQGSSSSSGAVRVSASFASATASVAAAEAFIDCTACATSGATGTGTYAGTGIPFVPSDGVFNSASESGYGDIPLTTVAALTAGNHTIYVHGKDSAGNWGTFASTVLVVNPSAPTVTSIVLTPPYTNNSAVAISASATDVATGNQNIAAGEYFIDTVGAAGTGTAMTATGTASPTRTLTATIPSATVGALAAGNHTVFVRARDAANNWSATFGAALVIDRTPPTLVSFVPNDPSPTNASSVSYTLTFSEPVTGLSSTDFVIFDAVGGTPSITSVNGSGAVWTVTQSTGNPGTTGTMGLDISSTATVADLAGNAWQVPANRTGPRYTVDKAAPTFTSITLTPARVDVGAASTTLTVNGAADAGTGVVGGEWWIGGTNIPAGTGTPFTGTSGITIPTDQLAQGAYTVRVRIRDAVGNWSTGLNGVRTATLTVAPPPPDAIFSDSFGSGNFSAWGTGGGAGPSTTTPARLNVTAGASLNGTPAFGMQAQGNNTNYVQFNFDPVLNPASNTFDARFYFNPNGNTGTNQDIFVARTSGGTTTVFRVRYRWNGGTPQVQIQVGTGTGNTAWTAINNAANRIEVVWQSGVTLVLYVNGVSSQTLTAATNAVGQFRLGSVTNGGSATLEYFDAFASKRTVSPLIGP